MRVVQGGRFWQLADRFDRFSSYRTYRWEILVQLFWPKHGLRSDLRVPSSQKIPGGACPQTPLACSYLSARNGRTSPEQLALALK